MRAELDPDNGGAPDGLEDLNRNGKLDPKETDPFNPEDDPVIEHPTAIFTYKPDIAWPNETITFNATQSHSPNGNIATYEWNFDNNNITTTTVPTINHIYTEQGNYEVTLTVTDENDLTNSTTRLITVTYRTDINKDKSVNIMDIATTAKAYNTRLGEPNWNDTVDMDNSGEINILDIATVAKDYGKTV